MKKGNSKLETTSKFKVPATFKFKKDRICLVLDLETSKLDIET